MSNNPAFARSFLGGKRTADVKSKVTDEVKFLLQREATRLGITESDFVCKLLEARLVGKKHVMSLQQTLLDEVAGAGPEVGHFLDDFIPGGASR